MSPREMLSTPKPNTSEQVRGRARRWVSEKGSVGAVHLGDQG